MMEQRPLRVGVLVDLEWGPEAGGHVKCWERLAEAAAQIPEALDLTVHFSHRETGLHEVAPNVRYRLHRPVFSTRSLPFLTRVPAHTDLAPYHPGVARWLEDYDVIHTTDAYFAFSKTAWRVAVCRGIPLVDSVHTDTPTYSRIYARRTMEGLGELGRVLEKTLDVSGRSERRALASLLRHQARAAHVLVSRERDRGRALGVLPPERIGRLRRGVDKAVFSPEKRDREAVLASYGIPAGRVVVFFAGRLGPCKRIGILVEAVRRLIAKGHDLHLVCAGDGIDNDAVREALGERASCPGFLPKEEVARLHASCDLFALAADTEIFANVLQEALASGAPILATREAGEAVGVRDGETGLLVDGIEPDLWEAGLEILVSDRGRREAMARAAQDGVDTLPTWGDVLAEDLLPVWRRVVEEAGHCPLP